MKREETFGTLINETICSLLTCLIQELVYNIEGQAAITIIPNADSYNKTWQLQFFSQMKVNNKYRAKYASEFN